MDIKTGFFYLFSAVLLFAAFRVITARNPVYAALYLVLAFFQAAAVWILLKAEFLAISLRAGFWKHFPLAATVGAIIALEMAAVLLGGFRTGEEPRTLTPAQAAAAALPNTRELGKLLYSQYLYPLEIAAVILLVAIIAAIALTLRKRKDNRHMDPSDQVRVRSQDRVRIVSMNPTLVQPEPPPVAAAVETKA
jgi:NADH-quinone oxidoreductase subunit J